jgi:hypothetical protein
MNYWKEALCSALEEAGTDIPPDDKLEIAAEVIEGAFDNYGMAHGHDCIPNPLKSEVERLSKDLKNERDKILCTNCNGRGRIRIDGPSQ